MTRLSIPLKRIDADLPIPQNAYPGDGGVDLCATAHFEVASFERVLVPCGIAVALPSGYAGFVIPRSGLALKRGITLVNSPGLIDSNYRGEIKAILMNLDPHETFLIERGDRIAQLVILCVEEASFTLCDDLSSTDRGAGGFGSSGLTI